MLDGIVAGIGELEVPDHQKTSKAAAKEKGKGKGKRVAQGQEPASSEVVRRQVEFYFSDQNYFTDKFLHSRADAEGFIDLELLLEFPRLRSLGVSSAAQLLEALRSSEILVLSGSRTCRAGPMPLANGAKGVATGPKTGQQAGAEYEELCPCAFHLAGGCRYGAACQLSHDLAYAAALEAQWLAPADKAAAAELKKRASDAGLRFEKRLLATQLGPGSGDAPATCAFRYLAVLDLEGKDEIIEFPVLLLEVESRREAGRFHRWVRPTKLCGPLPPGSPAIAFPQVLLEFDAWLQSVDSELSLRSSGSALAFVTCGDWDIRTQVPKQCELCGIELPPALANWINIKNLFNETHGTDIRGMKGALAKLGLLDASGRPKHGLHHLGMHDVDNIARVMLHLLEAAEEVRVTGSSLPAVLPRCGDESLVPA